jgi:hypothetical protein
MSTQTSTAPAAKTAETFSAAYVADRVRSAVDAVHASARMEFEALAGPLRESKERVAKLTAECADLAAKLKQAEQMSASRIGIRAPLPCELTASRGATPGSPAFHFAEWKSRVGPARSAYFSQHESSIWRAVEASAPVT